MSRVVLKAEDISKQYRLGLVGTGTVRDDLKRWWYNVQGKEDPFLKIGEANDRSTKGESDYVWSLQDINFEINQGDSVGIIGKNGAGKSTLLKILSQVTQPTTGQIYTKGRIASLLEVGTGFHPEMTGRENIYLNGAILGMRKHEITRKLDEIIAFSGVERYIDTPVKRYSSGMYVRLAFAVAAHLESEILIVDEVLAVGDAEFQKKCLGKMNDVSKGEGRTVLFVSHNMNAIQILCQSSIYLQQGKLISVGKTNDVIKDYLKVSATNVFNCTEEKTHNDVYMSYGEINSEFIVSDGYIIVSLIILSKTVTLVSIDFIIKTSTSIPVCFASIGTLNYDDMIKLVAGENKINIKILTNSLALGEYNLSIDITVPNEKYYDQNIDCLGFDVVKSKSLSRQLQPEWGYGYSTIPAIII